MANSLVLDEGGQYRRQIVKVLLEIWMMSRLVELCVKVQWKWRLLLAIIRTPPPRRFVLGQLKRSYPGGFSWLVITVSVSVTHVSVMRSRSRFR